MIAVGTIAYNVLVVHSGTMVDLKMLAARKKETAVCVTSALVMVLVSGVVLMPVLGKEFALQPGVCDRRRRFLRYCFQTGSGKGACLVRISLAYFYAAGHFFRAGGDLGTQTGNEGAAFGI